jgi:hypothetical protein
MTKNTPRWKLKFKCAAKDCTKKITGPDAYRLHLINTHAWKPERAKAQRDKQRKKTGPKSRKVIAQPVKAAIAVQPAT